MPLLMVSSVDLGVGGRLRPQSVVLLEIATLGVINPVEWCVIWDGNKEARLYSIIEPRILE